MTLLLLLACNGPKTDDTSPADDTGETGETGETGDSAETGETGETGDTSVSSLYDEKDLQLIRQAMRQDLRNNNAFAAQIAVWHGGEIVYSEAFGPRTEGGSETITTDTLFQIGSDTKKMTSILLLQRVEAGELSLDDTVAEALPGLSLGLSPEWAATTTLHQLISHQGGLYDYTPWDQDPGDEVLQERASGEFAGESWAMAPGGAMWNYANPNFSVAGLAVEVHAERPYADVLEEDLFAPLGMTRSFARMSEVLADGDLCDSFGIYDFVADPLDPLSAGATYSYGTTSVDGVVDNGFTRPAGLIWSTAEDQARFLGFLMHGDPTVLSEASRAALTSSQVLLYPSYPWQGYGYGLFVLDGFTLGDGWIDAPIWAHGGNTLTYTSTTYLLPEQDLAISVLSNGYGDNMGATVVALLEGSHLLPAPSSPPSGDWLTEGDHADYVGTYQDLGFGDFVVTDEDGALHVEFPYLESLGLVASADLDFVLRDSYSFTTPDLGTQELTFIPDDSGAFRWGRNRAFVGTRVESLTTQAGRLSRAQIEAALLSAERIPAPGQPFR